MVPLLAAAPPPGLELIYDGENFSHGQPSPMVMTVTADGLRARFDTDAAPLSFVIDGTKHEVATFATDKDVCFRVPESAAADVQVAALRKFQRSVQKDSSLSPVQKVDLLARTEQSIDAAHKPKPKRTQQFTWKQRTKVNGFTCELYDVSEAGADAGQSCLELKGKPPTSFEMALVDGDWWQGIDTLRLLGRLPVVFERKQNGELRNRLTLRSRREKKVDPAFFITDKACRPWTEMFPKDDSDPGLRGYAFELCKTLPHALGAAACHAEVEKAYGACSAPLMKKESSARAFVECLGFAAPDEP
jgi:hypothetical protein